MPIDSSKFQRRSSRARKSVDTFILSDVNTRKSMFQMSVGTITQEKSLSFDKREKCQISRP